MESFVKYLKPVFLVIIVLGIIISFAYLDSSSIMVNYKQEKPYYACIVLLYLYVHIRFNLFRFYNMLSVYFFGAIFLWWLPIIIIARFEIYEISSKLYWLSLLSFILILFFYEMLGFIIPTVDKKAYNLILSRISAKSQDNNAAMKIFAIACLLLSFAFSTLFFLKAGGIPYFSASPELARVEAMKGSGIIHRFSYLTLHFGAVLSAYYCWIKGGKVPFYLLLLITVVSGYNMLTGPRAEGLWGILLFLTTTELLKRGQIRLSVIAVAGLFICVIVAVTGFLRLGGGGGLDLNDIFFHFINRVYMNPVNAERIMEYYDTVKISPNSFWIDLSILLPGHQPDLGTYLKDLFGIEFEGGGITVPLTAEGFMNYGQIGVVAVSFSLSFSFKSFEYLLIKDWSYVVQLIILFILPFQLMGIITMGLSGIIVKNIIPAFIVMFFTYLFYAIVINFNKKHNL